MTQTSFFHDHKMRLILDPPRSATLNMAIDEILMESQRESAGLPVLRFYSWEGVSYSLGYFQDVQEAARRFKGASKKINIVRRITGGGMVLHGEDLTFSLSLRNPNPFLPGDTKSSYLKVNEALMAGLRKSFAGIDFADCKTVPSGRGGGDRVCFERPSCYDLLLQGKKVVGASQRRKNGAILHQSSVFIGKSRGELIEQILEGFRTQWGVEFAEMPLTEKELARAIEKEIERYNSPEWAFRPDVVKSVA